MIVIRAFIWTQPIFLPDLTHLYYFCRSILTLSLINSRASLPFERGLSSTSHYVSKQSLCIKCDAVSIVTSVIKLIRLTSLINAALKL